MQQNGSGNLCTGETNGLLGQSGQQIQKGGNPFTSDAGRKVNNNVSVQTGEEFSFLQDHVSARNVVVVPEEIQNYENRFGFNFNQNQHLGYEDLARILGLKEMDCEHTDDFVSAKSSSKEFENGNCGSKLSKQEKVNGDSVDQRNSNFGVSLGWNGVQAVVSPVYALNSKLLEGSQTSRIKFICSFGGKILPRPIDGKLRYVGGETRIISLRKNLSWEELMKKTTSVCKQPHTVKYQLPGEDLDALISVYSDEDLQNMIEEYQGPEHCQRLKIFLIPLGESENSSSLDEHTIQHSNPDYEYVVAVNGVIDPSPKETSSVHGLVRPCFQEKPPACTHPLEIKGDIGVPHQPQFFNDSRNITKPCNLSHPFSLVPPLREESNTVHKQCNADNPFQGSNESNSPFMTAQLPPEKSSFDTIGYNHFTQREENLINCLDKDYENQLHQMGQQIGVNIHNHNPTIENPSNFRGFSGDISNIMERPFQSDKPPSHLENPTRLISALSDPVDHWFGIPHAFSDSKLQEQSVLDAYSSQERMDPYFLLSCVKTNSDLFSYHASDNLLDFESTQSQDKPVFISAPCTKPLDSNEQLTIGHKEGFNQVRKTSEHEAPTREGKCKHSLHTNAFSDGFDEKKYNWRQDGELCEEKLPALVLDYSQHCASSKTTMSDKENDNSWIRNTKASKLIPTVNWHLHEEHSVVDFQSKVPVVQSTHEYLIQAPLSQHKETLFQEDLMYATHNQAGPSPNQYTGDLPIELQCPRKNVLFTEAVSLPDDIHNTYPDHKMEKSHFVASVDTLSNMKDTSPSLKKYNVKNGKPLNPKSPNLEENLSSTLNSDVQSSLTAALYKVDNSSYDVLSLTGPNAGIVIPDSDSEDAMGDDRDDVSISDALIAEMEASVYGLQIIRNADLEELQELGSGTYGTVYHGKWRGTDVAIKRIKKSCFAGRSSQQERLIKDFWREAQIISNLHHPNIVAFYGVVPDGTGETLATVTEYMINGSLRHVLLKKDRSLDHCKKLMIAMDAAFGMEYLHSKNIVHFDLKCDNLLVNLRDSERPVCKVGDFGLSKIKRNTLVSGGVRGTLPWMAPELLNGSSIRVSEKVDIYSFGICMWEILTGEEPYADMHCGAIIGGIVKNTLRPPIPRKCDSRWKKLMEECWSANPASRPSFTEITNNLRTMSAAIETKGQLAKSRKMKSNISS